MPSRVTTIDSSTQADKAKSGEESLGIHGLCSNPCAHTCHYPQVSWGIAGQGGADWLREELDQGFGVSGYRCGVVIGGDDGALDEDGVGGHGLDPGGAVGGVSGDGAEGFGFGFVGADEVPGFQVEAGEDGLEFFGGGWVVEVAADGVGDAGLVEGFGGCSAFGAGGVDPDLHGGAPERLGVEPEFGGALQHQDQQGDVDREAEEAGG